MAPSYRVILNERILRELREIASFISRQSPQNAVSVSERIVDTIDSLAVMPQRFKRVGKSRKSGSPVHAVVVRPFIISYRIDAEAVHVLSIRRGARRQPKHFE